MVGLLQSQQIDGIENIRESSTVFTIGNVNIIRNPKFINFILNYLLQPNNFSNQSVTSSEIIDADIYLIDTGEMLWKNPKIVEGQENMDEVKIVTDASSSSSSTNIPFQKLSSGVIPAPSKRKAENDEGIFFLQIF